MGTAGCLREIRSILNMDAEDRMELSIATVPADDDHPLVTIANRLRDNLEAIGVQTSIDLIELSEFRLQVLFNHDFDVAVVRHPGIPNPDNLYSLFHSKYAPERGWQNPYGLTNYDIDSLLDNQRQQSGTDRVSSIEQLLELIVQEQPVAPICFPTTRRFTRTAGFQPPLERPPTTSAEILAVSLSDPTDGLTVAMRETSSTVNLNPISIEFRNRGFIAGLLYDSLIRIHDGEVVPWLSSAITWDDNRAQVSLRDATWHDGSPVTSDDVAFTYRFFSDTTADDVDARAPVPRFRGRSSLVESIDVIDTTTLEFTFDAERTVARRAFTLPIIPRHIWKDRRDSASIGPISGSEMVTEALVTDNFPPVGSGPYRYRASEELEYLELERVDTHFTTSADDLHNFRPPAETMSFEAVPNEGTMIDGLESGAYEFALTPPTEAIQSELPTEISVLEKPGTELIHIAYNLKRSPLSNRNFRHIVSRMVDKVAIVDELFDGYARPTATPISDPSWVPNSLQWDGTDPITPFFGTSGEFDEESARSAIMDAGFSYDDEGYIINPE